MKEIIVVGLIFIIVGMVGQYYLQKKFNINEKVNTISKTTKRLQRIVLGIIFIIYLVILVALLIKYDEFNIIFLLVPFIIAVALVRAFTQWKYNRHANMWIQELFTAFMLSAFLITVMSM